MTIQRPNLNDNNVASQAYQSDPVDLSTTDAVFDPLGRGIYVGTGGTVVGRLYGDVADRTWKNVPSGATLGGIWKQITKTGTNAADILVLR